MATRYGEDGHILERGLVASDHKGPSTIVDFKKALQRRRSESMATKKKAKAKTKRRPARRAPQVDYDALRRSVKSDSSSGYWGFTETKHKITVIPYEHDGVLKAYYKEMKHFSLPDGTKVATCPGDTCPICAVRKANMDDPDLKDGLKRSTKYLMNIVDMGDPQYRIQQYRAPQTIWKAIMEIVLSDEDWPDALGSPGGVVFMMTKTGSGMDTEYTCAPAPKRTTFEPEGEPVVFEDLQREEDVDLEAIADAI